MGKVQQGKELATILQYPVAQDGWRIFSKELPNACIRYDIQLNFIANAR